MTANGMRLEFRGFDGLPEGTYPSRIKNGEIQGDGSVVVPVEYAPERSIARSVMPVTVGIDL